MLASHPKLHAWTYQTIHVVSLSAGIADFRRSCSQKEIDQFLDYVRRCSFFSRDFSHAVMINFRIFMGEVMSEMTFLSKKKWPG